MLESGSSGSVRGVLSNGHPYRDLWSMTANGGLVGSLTGPRTTGIGAKLSTACRVVDGKPGWRLCEKVIVANH